MMTKRILTICAAVPAGTAAGTSLALAQAYPPPPGAVYSTAPQPYVQGGYPAAYRRGPGVPDFDPLAEDEAMNSPALAPSLPTVPCPPGRSWRRVTRVTVPRMVRRRAIPTAMAHPPVRSCRRMI